MSILLPTSPKHCAKQQGLHLKKPNKKLIYGLATFILSTLSFLFLIWLILHPSKPNFYLKGATLYSFALPHILNSTIEATIVSTNPNTRVGVYYDHLRAFSLYKEQRITGDSILPPFYQNHGDTSFLSASLFGPSVSAIPPFGYEVDREQTVGEIVLGIKLVGQLRWKIGWWVSERYGFTVNCEAVMGIKDGQLRSPQGSQCSITI